MKCLRKIALGVAFCSLLLPSAASAGGAEAELLLYERDPWLTVIGSDSPLLACYTDGRMIFLDRAASGRSGAVYKSFRLDGEELAELRARMRTLDSLQAHYELSHATDQKTTQLVFRSGGKMKRVGAYGGVPPEMGRFIHFLNALHRRAGARARSWQPSFIEVMLWPFDHARGEPTPWPGEFPGLDSPATVKWRESSYSIYLPAGEEKALRSFMKSRQGNAVLLDGKKWSVAARIPFPHEIPAGLTATPP